MQLCGGFGAVFPQQWFLHSHKAFCLIVSIFVTVTRFATSQYGMYYLTLSGYRHRFNLAADGTRALPEEHRDRQIRRDAPLGGCCGETMELEGRQPTINTPPPLSRDQDGIHEIERFCFEKRMNRVRRFDTTWR